ncbi:MAG: hypothetical protein NTW96_00245 [Planctomycetia bacterium]|nr:hypothetical protein [Planctomycetia bacterium]
MTKPCRIIVHGAGIFLVIAVVLVAVIAPVSTDSVSVCEITGSIRHHRTWLKVISNDAYEASPLEEFIESECPGALRHKWMWISASRNNVVGCPIVLEDSFRSTYLLAEFVRSHAFADLSDEDKKSMYKILEWSSDALSDPQKRALHSDLLNCADAEGARAIMRSYRTSGGTP